MNIETMEFASDDNGERVTFQWRKSNISMEKE